MADASVEVRMEETAQSNLLDRSATPVEGAIEAACVRAEQWYRTLPRFRNRVNLGSVTGFRHPALLSEHDCVIHFARFLKSEDIPWDAMHHQLAISRWIFDAPHPAATTMTPGQRRRKIDLALLPREELLAATLPAKKPGFQFDAFLEFKYLSDYWTLPKVRVFGGDPLRGRESVEADVEKIGHHLATTACRFGYVIVFEECDWGFPATFASDVEANTGCRVRFVRGYPPPCAECGSDAVLPIVWGMPSPELQRQADEGWLVLGGCLVHGNGLDPEWHCQRCEHRWRSS